MTSLPRLTVRLKLSDTDKGEATSPRTPRGTKSRGSPGHTLDVSVKGRSQSSLKEGPDQLTDCSLGKPFLVFSSSLGRSLTVFLVAANS